MAFLSDGIVIVDDARNLIGATNINSWVRQGTSLIASNAVGSYAFLSINDTSGITANISYGGTVSGTLLKPCSIRAHSIFTSNYDAVIEGGTVTGTWQCQGIGIYRASIDYRIATIFLRIA